MFEQFLHFIFRNKLLQQREPVLLAVSGGVDSVVLCRLFSQATFPFGIAHCNFQLRGSDAQEDEQFVKVLAATCGAPFYYTRFETKNYAAEKGISIEMAARDLRYAWLEQMRKANNFHKIATAHHRDDNVETVLLNLVKGTGISGLHGILPQRDKIIRPLLQFGKEEILSFAQSEKLAFRVDHTNFESVYQRNLLRNEVIPKLQQLNPAFLETFAGNIEKFKDAEALYKTGLNNIRKKLLEQRGQDWYLPVKKLLLLKSAKTVLFELLKEFGFGEKHTEQIFNGLQDETPKEYLSDKHRVIQHCNFLIITQKQTELQEIHFINDSSSRLKLPEGELRFHLMQGAIVKENSNANTACIDFDKLIFPLILRRRKQGDYFYPQGMNGKKKKLSDFLTDLKLSPLEKERVWTLESEGRIVWIAGFRIDERFSITAHTKKTIIIKLR